MLSARVLAGLLLGLITAAAAAGEVTRERNPNTGLWIYKTEQGGLGIELIALHAEFIRATYGAKGFTDEMLDEAAAYCAFGTIARNLTDQPLAYRVADWRAVTADGTEHALKTKSEWVEEWHGAGIPFSWSILPDSPTFQVGDWAQGFTTVKLPRDATFDLRYTFTVGDEKHVAVIENIECPPERLAPR